MIHKLFTQFGSKPVIMGVLSSALNGLTIFLIKNFDKYGIKMNIIFYENLIHIRSAKERHCR